MRMSVLRQMPVAPRTYGEGRKSSVGGSCGDGHADAGLSDATAQPANNSICRNHCQRAKDHRSGGLTDQQWVLDGYLLTLSALLISLSSLTDSRLSNSTR